MSPAAARDLLEVVEDEQRPLRVELGREDVDRACATGRRRGRPSRRSRGGTSDASATGGERHEPGRRPGTRPRRRPRAGAASRVLPVPPGPGEGHERGSSSSARGLVELALAADERRQLRGQVVGPRVERPDRREVGRQARRRRAGDRSGRRSLSRWAPRTRSGRRRAARRRRRSTAASDSEHLAAVRGRRDPRGAMDVVADVRRRPRRARPTPVWSPIRTRIAAPSGHGSAASARWASTAAATASAGARKTTKNESPSVPISSRRGRRAPPGSARGGARGAAASAAVPRLSTSRVEPSMSVNRKVTSPVGRLGRGRGVARSAGS